ncbi:MAG: hypothetical protein KY468_01970 [Armatimonadetes bacterium]|nr:hypothetical protein [Armatimonadota bacterium]
MSSLTVLLILLIILVLSALIWRLAYRPSQRVATSPVESYLSLRNRALHLRPDDLGLERIGPDTPYAVLMESGEPGAEFTLFAGLSGDASLYLAAGGGVIGGIDYESVRDAARRFVAAVEPYLSWMAKADSFPLPTEGRTHFYVLTPGVVYTIEENENDLGENESPFSPLFYAGHEVFTRLREVAEGD